MEMYPVGRGVMSGGIVQGLTRQAMELTATRRVFTFHMTKLVSLRATSATNESCRSAQRSARFRHNAVGHLPAVKQILVDL